MYNPMKQPEIPKLGDKLKSIVDELNDANIKNEEDRANADIEIIRKNKQKKIIEIEEIKKNIVDQIKNDKFPYVKITDDSLRNWIMSAKKGNAEFQEVWSAFVTYFKYEKCSVIIKEENKNTPYITITLEPQLYTTRDIMGSIPRDQ